MCPQEHKIQMLSERPSKHYYSCLPLRINVWCLNAHDLSVSRRKGWEMSKVLPKEYLPLGFDLGIHSPWLFQDNLNHQDFRAVFQGYFLNQDPAREWLFIF